MDQSAQNNPFASTATPSVPVEEPGAAAPPLPTPDTSPFAAPLNSGPLSNTAPVSPEPAGQSPFGAPPVVTFSSPTGNEYPVAKPDLPTLTPPINTAPSALDTPLDQNSLSSPFNAPANNLMSAAPASLSPELPTFPSEPPNAFAVPPQSPPPVQAPPPVLPPSIPLNTLEPLPAASTPPENTFAAPPPPPIDSAQPTLNSAPPPKKSSSPLLFALIGFLILVLLGAIGVVAYQMFIDQPATTPAPLIAPTRPPVPTVMLESFIDVTPEAGAPLEDPFMADEATDSATAPTTSPETDMDSTDTPGL